MRNRSIGSSSHGGRCRCADAWNGAPRSEVCVTSCASLRRRGSLAPAAGTPWHLCSPSAAHASDAGNESRALRARGAILGTSPPCATACSAQFALGQRCGCGVDPPLDRGPDVRAAGRRLRRSSGDAWSARFGEFDEAHLAGLVDGEWPEPARRNIFYSSSILRELGWPAESDRLAGERALFADLAAVAVIPTHGLCLHARSGCARKPSSLIDELDHAGFETMEAPASPVRIFELRGTVF